MSTHYVWWLRTKHGYTLYNSIRKNLRGPPLYGELPLFGEQSTEAANYGALGTTIGEAAMRLIERKFVDAKKTELTDRMECVYTANPEMPRSTKDPVYRSAAVDIVYTAFKGVASKRKNQDLRSFGREQTFFQMMCYLMCEGSLRDAKVPEWSCNQAVKDSHNFGKVFGCPIGSPMNPTSKCRLLY
ncbi:neprilysin-1-like [Dermacentor silvarum]|uniref:neprilysin-1-like n=1 Tax=Dermacentor silvarum TaxID=543639 RepID=UPI002101C57D|nr:neprilysin-1-like [Dermacentor silvarum]